ncbi:hypothetical protein HNP76_002199 [Treponema ruminis]|uniref:Uncharacterized protein n=1 Tax=Treponema ruminis TaxID=744515 RepID=A0A7W8LMZ1_9SPIR|nr:hypothetical protein [Treponema ruminis]
MNKSVLKNGDLLFMSDESEFSKEEKRDICCWIMRRPAVY